MSTTPPTTLVAATPSIYANVASGDFPLTILLKGDSGTGKTTKAAKFPRPVLFNWDNNLSGLRKLPLELQRQVRVVDPRKDLKTGKEVPALSIFDNFVAQLEIVAEDKTVGTMIVDSITTMAESLMDKIIKSASPGAKVEIQHWGEFWRYCKWLGEELLCAPTLDKHVVWIAHEQLKEYLDPKGQAIRPPKYLLTLGGKAKSDLDMFFTDVWRCYNKAGPNSVTEFWVRVNPTDYHTAKSSLTLPADFKWENEEANIIRQLNERLPLKPLEPANPSA